MADGAWSNRARSRLSALCRQLAPLSGGDVAGQDECLGLAVGPGDRYGVDQVVQAGGRQPYVEGGGLPGRGPAQNARHDVRVVRAEDVLGPPAEQLPGIEAPLGHGRTLGHDYAALTVVHVDRGVGKVVDQGLVPGSADLGRGQRCGHGRVGRGQPPLGFLGRLLQAVMLVDVDDLGHVTIDDTGVVAERENVRDHPDRFATGPDEALLDGESGQLTRGQLLDLFQAGGDVIGVGHILVTQPP